MRGRQRLQSYPGTGGIKSAGDAQLSSVTLRLGQAHVKRWVDDILPLVSDGADPLGVLDLVTHQVPLEEAPHMYEVFQKKQDDCIKVVLKP